MALRHGHVVEAPKPHDLSPPAFHNSFREMADLLTSPRSCSSNSTTPALPEAHDNAAAAFEIDGKPLLPRLKQTQSLPVQHDLWDKGLSLCQPRAATDVSFSASPFINLWGGETSHHLLPCYNLT